MRSSLIATFAAVLVASALLAGEAQAAKPIKVAVEAPLSGSQSSNGLDILRGVQLAVRQANSHDGVLGRRVEIVKADDRGEAGKAVGVAQRVIKRKAVAVIGPYNSSVGIRNLPIYLGNNVVPVHLTSTDDTRGEGVTIQPKNSQIAPLEGNYVGGTAAKRVTMLVDDSANGAFTIGMADRLQKLLAGSGSAVTVNRISVKELADAGPGYYPSKVAEALATNPDLLYVSTYFPEGAKIAAALAAVGSSPPCLMGLANVDPGFVSSAGLSASQRCVFSGVPAAPQLGSAKTFVRQYRKAFKKSPGVWGVFAYDSTRMLFAAMERSGTTAFSPLLHKLRHTRGFRGQTGTSTIDPVSGYRVKLPFLHILRVDARGDFVIAA